MTRSAIHPDRILRDLDTLWVELGRGEPGQSSLGVLRACAMTLVVITRDKSPHPPVNQTLAPLIKQHPPRAIALRISSGRRRRLHAAVTAECWMPSPGRQQICCERIDIDSTQAALSDLVPVLRGLAAPDLPLILWCRDWDALTLRALNRLLPLAAKVIVNSAGCPNPAPLLARFAKISALGPIVADLSWTRLTRWRQTIANVFESHAQRSALTRLRRVTIGHYGPNAPVRALYLYGWLRSVLGPEPNYRLTPARRPKPCQPGGEVRSVRLQGPSLDFSLTQIEGETVELRLNGRTQTLIFPIPKEWELLSEELSIEGRDPHFEAALRFARKFPGA